MHDRLRQLATIASRCTAFALVTGPDSELYDFGPDWDSFFKTFKEWCKGLSVRYVDATLVAEHIEKVDQYHGRKTVANVTKLVSFFTSLLQVLQVDLKMNKFESAFDSLLARKLELTYDEANEIKSDDTAAAQKASYLAMKQKVVQHRIAQLGPSRMFTAERIEVLPPVDEQLIKLEMEEMTAEAVKIELENLSQIVDPMDVDADAPRKRQAESVGTVTSNKQKAVSFDLPATSSSVLGSSEKAAPTMPKIATAMKSKPEVHNKNTNERPDPPDLPSSSSSVSRPDPPPLPSEVSKSVPPPPKGVSAAAPPPKQRNPAVDRVDYFDMAVTGLPGHALLIPQDVERKQEVRISVPGALQVLPLEPMLGSQLTNLPGIDHSKVPKNIKALRAVSGVMRGYMCDWLAKRTDCHGFAHIDDVKRELLTGGYKREVQNWNIEVFTSIAAFDEKDRFEVLAASIMTFSNYDQGFTDFQLKGLDDGERRAMLQTDFDQHLQVAATQHYQSDWNSKQNRKADPVLEDVERKREDESLTPPEEALSKFSGYEIRPSKKLVPKEPSGPPPMHLRRPAKPPLPPDVRDPPAVPCPASAAARLAQPDFQLRTAGRWRWDRNFGDWVWEQQFDPLETDPYSPCFRPSDSTLNNWMGHGWIDWTARFGYRSY